jgi:peptidoglycan hydrolase-like protein with peptidoglycan-binding domain
MLDLHDRPAGAGWPGVDRRSADYVYWLQQALGHLLGIALPPDGVLDARTRQALCAFQRRHGLPVDGVAGPRVEAALLAAGAPPPPLDATGDPDLNAHWPSPAALTLDAPPAPVPSARATDALAGPTTAAPPVPAATRDRRSPEYVRWAQRALNHLVGARLVESGIVDLPTRAAVRVFQARHGLVADGVLGPRAEAALLAAGALPLAGIEPPEAGGPPLADAQLPAASAPPIAAAESSAASAPAPARPEPPGAGAPHPSGTEPPAASVAPSASTAGDSAPRTVPRDTSAASTVAADLRAASSTAPPDVWGDRVDAVAAAALHRLAAEPGSGEAAAAMLAALAAGRLGGIYSDDAPLPARIADQLHVARSALVPLGEDATLTRDPTPDAAPIVVFRADAAANGGRLGAALLAAWRTLALLESGRLLPALPAAGAFAPFMVPGEHDALTHVPAPPHDEPASAGQVAAEDSLSALPTRDAAPRPVHLPRAAGVWLCPDDSRRYGVLLARFCEALAPDPGTLPSGPIPRAAPPSPDVAADARPDARDSPRAGEQAVA